MDVLQNIFPLLGLGLCALAALQLVLWTAHSVSAITLSRKQFDISQKLLRKQIEFVERQRQQLNRADRLSWTGYRPFRVQRLVQETPTSTSVYLKPDDGRSIPEFKPGQYLTLRLVLPGAVKPVVRCYSISQAPGNDNYRITVKASRPTANVSAAGQGSMSQFINSDLIEGDLVDVKAPAGSFYLDEKSKAPAVLLAGGIGITPMISMLDHVITTGSDRLMILIYSLRNGQQHVFKDYLNQISRQYTNIHIITCYSDPLPTEREGIDFHRQGRVDTELLKQVLPNNRCQFYLCGPAGFIRGIGLGLRGWRVPDSRIFIEPFCAESLQQTGRGHLDRPPVEAEVLFRRSRTSTAWKPGGGSLMQVAGQSGIPVESGCRVGNCGSCQVAILNGKVCYPQGRDVDCDPGMCRLCVAQPDGPVELDI